MDTTFKIIHYSGNTFMPVRDYGKDVDFLIKRDPTLLVCTEGGEQETVNEIRSVATRRMVVVNPDRGDITFLLHSRAKLIDHGGPLAIPAKGGGAQAGGHGPRHNSWIKFELDGETITHTGVHFVTRDADHHPGGGDRHDEQLEQARLMGQQMEKFGAGRQLATGSGDLNSKLPDDDKMQAVFDNHNLTTTAHEANVPDATHGEYRRIDYIWTYDEDRRLYVKRMRVLHTGEVHSDHDPVEVVVGVRS